jgi:hypothetical protein
MSRCKTFALSALIVLGLFAAGLAASPQEKGKGKGKGKFDDADPAGKPRQFDAGEVTGYAVWHGKKGWHLRTTTKKRQHHFKGSIEVAGGTIESIHSHHLEAEGKLQDHWKVGPKRHVVAFDFKTDEGTDGIDFTVSKDAKGVQFHLHSDGQDRPNHVWIGQRGEHPERMPFWLHAPPKKT